MQNKPRTECNHRWLTVASPAMMWLIAALGDAAAAEPPRIDLTSDSPFGVVCPWPGVSKAGIQWCRVGAGATQLANWPGIEKERGKFDWTDADAELKNFDDPEGLSLLPILGYTPKWGS
ncbi:MAG: hypothetical protein ACC645_19665, partial [Pirellulales bacterium]